MSLIHAECVRNVWPVSNHLRHKGQVSGAGVCTFTSESHAAHPIMSLQACLGVPLCVPYIVPAPPGADSGSTPCRHCHQDTQIWACGGPVAMNTCVWSSFFAIGLSEWHGLDYHGRHRDTEDIYVYIYILYISYFGGAT
eukprot:1138301-Pelagomonas_calceolata.AAC.4